MNFEITIKNYRCFSDLNPVRFVFQKGFTAFVGVNNAGKSSLLKFFYEFRSIFEQLSIDKDNGFNFTNKDNIFNSVLSGNYIPFKKPSTVRYIEELFYNGNERSITIEIKLSEPVSSSNPLIDKVQKLVLTIPRAENKFTAKLYYHTGDILSRYEANFYKPFGEIFYKLKNTLYISSFRNILNVEFMRKEGEDSQFSVEKKYFDIDAGIYFLEKWRSLKHGSDKRGQEILYTVTQDICRIFNFNSLEINASDDEFTLFLIIDGKSYKLSEQGSGITQFILVLANAAIKQPDYILIDEPELNLHPSLQLDFLTSLGSFAKEGVLFATHSIGLARSSAELIYSICKSNKGGSEIRQLEATRNLSQLLGELNFSTYNELGFDKILLVEGATEVRTIQQFLRKYGKEHQIVLLSLGGSDMIKEKSEAELAEIKRISQKIFALIDSERSNPSADLDQTRNAFCETCKKLGIECRVLERRAMENYFPDRAIKEFKGPKYQELQPYDKLEDAQYQWGKAENWRIAQKMTKEELDNTDLGEFLASL
ncbi:AAA family ATPase [Coleofasciculus sp. FACHB-712]|uniref:ATP-dependent nuclease n=1 Tax=Coleofasciculus sp. FACHB-712 TaxID=2692789 RepID=UPI0016842579|nr:AAA family ATPase [Coleofasciculus sp. FACHB-712]MBD1943992.1 AAA family ATPase [Coleofasciculus sp. FACHB-712]